MGSLQEKRDLGILKKNRETPLHLKGWALKQYWRKFRITGKCQMKWQSMPANILKSMSMTRDETKASHLTVQYNAKIMDSHLVELLEESENEKRHCPWRWFQEVTDKTTNGYEVP